MIYSTRLLLNTTYNTRELGGYPAPAGFSKWGVFLRSDDLTDMTAIDIRCLEKYGVTTIIDLRSSGEVQQKVYPQLMNIVYKNIPLVKGEIGDATKVQNIQKVSFLSGFYINCIENSKEEIKEIFDLIGQVDGCVVFHCAAGKDRTGILSMLLLGSIGVFEQDIVANYQSTYTYLKKDPIFRKQVKQYPIAAMRSDPDSMEMVLQHIKDNYHTILNYLLSIGITGECLTTIQNRFLDKIYR